MRPSTRPRHKIDKQLRKSREKMIERHHERQRLADVEAAPEA
jgi:hypothetical protein